MEVAPRRQRSNCAYSSCAWNSRFVEEQSDARGIRQLHTEWNTVARPNQSSDHGGRRAGGGRIDPQGGSDRERLRRSLRRSDPRGGSDDGFAICEQSIVASWLPWKKE